MCNCIEEMNNALEEQTINTRLDRPILISVGEIKPAEKVLIATVKRDDRNRNKPVRLYASYCPFCGEKYDEAKT